MFVTLKLLQSLGFIVHPGKSVFELTRRIQYLGVIIDSQSMTVMLTPEKQADIIVCCSKAEKKESLTIRDLAKIMAKIVASFPAVVYGPLHYRQLEKEKKVALALNKGDFDGRMTLSLSAKSELRWWNENTEFTCNVIHHTQPNITLSSDASKVGWGCARKDSQSGGEWLPEESSFHINHLELKAVYFALKRFQGEIVGKHACIMIDNTTAVACINHMGTSHSESCSMMTQTLWHWWTENDVWLSATFIPGKQNTAADKESRAINLDMEWKLDPTALSHALSHLQAHPDIDLFASRTNKQFDRYVSYRPDPNAYAVDGLSLRWRDLDFYAFPPFSVVSQVLGKVKREGAMGVVVVPRWTTQVWWCCCPQTRGFSRYRANRRRNTPSFLKCG